MSAFWPATTSRKLDQICRDRSPPDPTSTPPRRDADCRALFSDTQLEALKTSKHRLVENDRLSEKYHGFASELLAACGYKSLEQILDERIAAFRRRSAHSRLEQLMLEALLYRREKPWCGAVPVVDAASWDELSRRFPLPSVQIGEELGTIFVDDQELMNEVVMELHFQSFALAVFGEFSAEARAEGAMECAFSKFNIAQGCPYQVSHDCSGRFKVAAGPPFPVETGIDGELSGCGVAMLFQAVVRSLQDAV